MVWFAAKVGSRKEVCAVPAKVCGKCSQEVAKVCGICLQRFCISFTCSWHPRADLCVPQPNVHSICSFFQGLAPFSFTCTALLFMKGRSRHPGRSTHCGERHSISLSSCRFNLLRVHVGQFQVPFTARYIDPHPTLTHLGIPTHQLILPLHCSNKHTRPPHWRREPLRGTLHPSEGLQRLWRLSSNLYRSRCS